MRGNLPVDSGGRISSQRKRERSTRKMLLVASPFLPGLLLREDTELRAVASFLAAMREFTSNILGIKTREEKC